MPQMQAPLLQLRPVNQLNTVMGASVSRTARLLLTSLQQSISLRRLCQKKVVVQPDTVNNGSPEQTLSDAVSTTRCSCAAKQLCLPDGDLALTDASSSTSALLLPPDMMTCRNGNAYEMPPHVRIPNK